MQLVERSVGGRQYEHIKEKLAELVIQTVGLDTHAIRQLSKKLYVYYQQTMNLLETQGLFEIKQLFDLCLKIFKKINITHLTTFSRHSQSTDRLSPHHGKNPSPSKALLPEILRHKLGGSALLDGSKCEYHYMMSGKAREDKGVWVSPYDFKRKDADQTEMEQHFRDETYAVLNKQQIIVGMLSSLEKSDVVEALTDILQGLQSFKTIQLGEFDKEQQPDYFPVDKVVEDLSRALKKSQQQIAYLFEQFKEHIENQNVRLQSRSGKVEEKIKHNSKLLESISSNKLKLEVITKQLNGVRRELGRDEVRRTRRLEYDADKEKQRERDRENSKRDKGNSKEAAGEKKEREKGNERQVKKQVAKESKEKAEDSPSPSQSPDPMQQKSPPKVVIEYASSGEAPSQSRNYREDQFQEVLDSLYDSSKQEQSKRDLFKKEHTQRKRQILKPRMLLLKSDRLKSTTMRDKKEEGSSGDCPQNLSCDSIQEDVMQQQRQVQRVSEEDAMQQQRQVQRVSEEDAMQKERQVQRVTEEDAMQKQRQVQRVTEEDAMQKQRQVQRVSETNQNYQEQRFYSEQNEQNSKKEVFLKARGQSEDEQPQFRIRIQEASQAGAKWMTSAATQTEVRLQWTREVLLQVSPAKRVFSEKGSCLMEYFIQVSDYKVRLGNVVYNHLTKSGTEHVLQDGMEHSLERDFDPPPKSEAILERRQEKEGSRAGVRKVGWKRRNPQPAAISNAELTSQSVKQLQQKLNVRLSVQSIPDQERISQGDVELSNSGVQEIKLQSESKLPVPAALPTQKQLQINKRQSTKEKGEFTLKAKEDNQRPIGKTRERKLALTLAFNLQVVFETARKYRASEDSSLKFSSFDQSNLNDSLQHNEIVLKKQLYNSKSFHLSSSTPTEVRAFNNEASTLVYNARHHNSILSSTTARKNTDKPDKPSLPQRLRPLCTSTGTQVDSELLIAHLKLLLATKERVIKFHAPDVYENYKSAFQMTLKYLELSKYFTVSKVAKESRKEEERLLIMQMVRDVKQERQEKMEVLEEVDKEAVAELMLEMRRNVGSKALKEVSRELGMAVGQGLCGVKLGEVVHRFREFKEQHRRECGQLCKHLLRVYAGCRVAVCRRRELKPSVCDISK